MSTANLNLAFTGQTFLVGYTISRHLMGDRTHRLYDKEHNALIDFLDNLGVDNSDCGRWVDTTPAELDGYEGVCAVTGRKSENLQRMALISWEEVQA